jgi:hypothetical protein
VEGSVVIWTDGGTVGGGAILTEVGTEVSSPTDRPLTHLTNRAIIKHKREKRHRERLGAMVGSGHFRRSGVMLTVTYDNATLGRSDKAEVLNSVLTALGARLRRAGVTARVTAREYGSKRLRLHNHVVADVEFGDLIRMAREHWRGFQRFAREWRPDEGAIKAMFLQARWVERGCPGERPHFARTWNECVMGRYLAAQVKVGFVDVMEVDGKQAVGYCLAYAGKAYGPQGRVSYSRKASEPWAHKAHLQVYAYKGECYYYKPRRPEWIEREVGRLDRRDLRRDHTQKVLRSQAMPSLLMAMERKQAYLAMTAANDLRFKAMESHEAKAAAIEYRIGEIGNPDMEREAITSADEG